MPTDQYENEGPHGLRRKWRDLGDGTYAPSVYDERASGSGSQVEIVDSATGADVIAAPAAGTEKGLAVHVISQPAGGAGTVQYAEDTAATAGEAVVMVGVVRKDARASLVDADGDRAELQVNANGELRIKHDDVQPVSGTVTANAGTGPFPVSDNAGSLTVDAPVGTPVFVRLSDGTAAIATLPVSLASLPTLAAGTNNIGDVDVLTLPALPAGTNNIGDVDVLTLPALPAGTNNIGDVDVLTINGQAPAFNSGVRGATVLRVTQATDDVVHVDDNSGSLTVDAPVGTPVFTRLSDGTAALVGQKTMANSLPVVVASDQTALDVSDRAAREVGRTRLWDGTDEATITPLRTTPATTEKALVVREIPNRLTTFSAAIATQTPAITIGVKELLALWHASTQTKDIYIVEIWVTGLVTTASTTGGRTTVRVSTITSAPTGGTALTPIDTAGGTTDMTNTMAVKTGGGAIGTTFIRKIVWHATQAVGSRIGEPIFQASNPGNGLILPAGSNGGISVDIEREVAHTALVDVWTVGARWLEI